jgi:hypothetical protein
MVADLNRLRAPLAGDDPEVLYQVSDVLADQRVQSAAEANGGRRKFEAAVLQHRKLGRAFGGEQGKRHWVAEQNGLLVRGNGRCRDRDYVI